MTNVSQAVQVLVDAKSEVMALLDKNNLTAISIEHGLDRLINKLKFLDGQSLDSGRVQTVFGPITEFMGEKINYPVKIAEEEIVPEPTAVELFVKKVDEFQEQLPILDSAKVIDSYKTKEDLKVIRGAAKRAGLEDFKTAEITVDYVDQIKAGLAAKIAEKAKTDKVNADLPK